MRSPILLLGALAAPLLFILPAYVIANGCTHFEMKYQVPIPSPIMGRPQTPPLPDKKVYAKAFAKNADIYNAWAKKEGGSCQGYCTDVQRVPVGFGYETYEMYCRSARLSKKSSGIPAPVAGIIHAYGDGGKRLCDVNCSNGGGQTCYFQFEKC